MGSGLFSFTVTELIGYSIGDKKFEQNKVQIDDAESNRL